MLTVTFSGYAKHPGEERTSVYPQFGRPSAKIDGERPTRLRLSGSYNNHVTHEIRNQLTVWLFTQCVMSMHATNRYVEIDADLPDELAQWYIAVEHYKGVAND